MVEPGEERGEDEGVAPERALRTRIRVALAWVVLLGLAPFAATAIGATFFYAVGNGLFTGFFALATVPVMLVLVPLSLAHPSRQRLGALAALLLGNGCYATWRITRVQGDDALPLCIDGVCGATAPLLARLVREDETAYAGIALSYVLGMVNDAELAVAGPATHAAYDRLATLRRGVPGPNGVFLTSQPEQVSELIWMPPGDGKVPALLFLHGFGGELTPCLSAFADSPLGERYAIVAPALDMKGYWWERRGRAVLARTLDTLPPRVDRDQLWLVGLSNGAIGATHLGFDPELGPRFHGTILVVGADALREGDVPRGPVLLVPGLDDPRFPFAGIQGAADLFREAGLDVTLKPIEGDHFILFTRPKEVTGVIAEWLAERGG